jgi:histidinol-phosphatase (PHP family)
MYANYHTHTFRCNHARGTERAYIETAIERGMQVLGFADHVPYPFPGGFESHFRMKCAEIEDYIATLQALRQEYADQIEIHIGFEAEYYPLYHQRLLEFLQPYPYEYLIMGQHFIANEIDAPLYGAGLRGKEQLELYVDQVVEGLRTGDFVYLAHPDLPSKEGDTSYYKEAMTRLCREVKALDIPLELNFLGLAEGRAYPCRTFWEIAGQVGNKVIFGCDAHDAHAVADPAIIEQAKAWQSEYDLCVIDRIQLHRPRTK